MIVSFLGVFGAANEKGMLLKTYFALLCILVIFEISVGVAAYVKRDAVQTLLEDSWRASVLSNSSAAVDAVLKVEMAVS